jgi:ferritin
MIKQTLQDAINEQINKEIFSEYYYLSMVAYFESEDLPGFAQFFKVQVEEERFHGMKFFDYLNERGGKVILKGIENPKTDFESPLQVFELAYKHEQYVTELINNLMDIAIKENDHALQSFLQWFIDEQVEEEASMSKYVNQLKRMNGNGHGIIMIDRELAQRTFVPPIK